MKKIFISLILFISFISTAYAATGTVYCPDNRDPVNLRPSINAAATQTLACDSTVEVISTNAGTNYSSGCTTQFYQVKQGFKSGYACGTYIKLNSSSTTTEGKVKCIEDTSPLGVYSNTSRTKDSKIKDLSCGTKVTILEKDAANDGRTGNVCSTKLYKIQYENTIGYVCGRYIEELSSSGGGSTSSPTTIGKSTSGDNIYKKENYQTKPNSDGTINCYEDTGALSLRSTPGGSSTGKSLSCGAEVNINSVKESSGMCPYYYNVTDTKGNSGYVCGYYVNTTKLSSTAEDYYKSHSLDDYYSTLRSVGFPDSYLPYLAEMHARHPNWKFVAEQIPLTFDEVVNGENAYGLNLLQGSAFDKNYYSMGINSYDILKDEFYQYSTEVGWYDASSEAVAYYLDPRNYLNVKYIFAYELLHYNDAQTESAVSSILTKKSFWNTVYSGKDSNISKDIVTATKDIGISSFHVATRVEQEIAGISTSDPRAGGSFTYNGTEYSNYYNFFNIGVWGTDKILRGMKYAIDNGWNTPYKGIYGGSRFIYNDYYKVNQDTLYYEKFDVSTSDGNYDHQYMQNLAVVTQETNKAYKAYVNNISSYINTALEFTIPVYKNMPNYAVTSPKTGNPNNYLKDLKVNNNTLSGFSYDKYDYEMTVPASTTKVNISAVTASNSASTIGTGDISINSTEKKTIIVVTAESGSTRKYTITIKRPSSSTEDVPSINTILNNSGIKYNSDYIYGIGENTSVSSLINNVEASSEYANINIKDKQGNSKRNGTFVTGDKVTIGNGKEEKTMNIVIYGDINGDGKIDRDDCLAILRQLNGYTTLQSAYKTAADANKDGKIDRDDCLAILRHLNGYTNLNK